MRSFRWIPDFRLDVESSIVSVWNSLPNLPLFLFKKHGSFSIGSFLGKPLILDATPADLTRPSVARIWVEIDLLNFLPHRSWLDCELIDGFWQDVIFEKLPHYCKHCKGLGHYTSNCKMAHPDLAKKNQSKKRRTYPKPLNMSKNSTPKPYGD